MGTVDILRSIQYAQPRTLGGDADLWRRRTHTHIINDPVDANLIGIHAYDVRTVSHRHLGVDIREGLYARRTTSNGGSSHIPRFIPEYAILFLIHTTKLFHSFMHTASGFAHITTVLILIIVYSSICSEMIKVK